MSVVIKIVARLSYNCVLYNHRHNCLRQTAFCSHNCYNFIWNLAFMKASIIVCIGPIDNAPSVDNILKMSFRSIVDPATIKGGLCTQDYAIALDAAC